jgi:mannosyl-3-phosphoglycerate phosphatase
MNRFVVFTDLDGTLLDHESYSVRLSVPALDLLQRRGCPVVPVSSKTSAEIRQWRRILFLNDPYVCENGCGIVIPKSCFTDLPAAGVDQGSEWRINLGMGIKEVRRHLLEIGNQTGVHYRGFEQMSDDEISCYTGLAGEELQMCRQREYDEPFIVNDEKEAEKLRSMTGQRGLVLTKGGRFHHLTGGCDKGKAVQILADLYRKESPDIMTVAIGDSHNDLPMFRVVDKGYLVGKPDGSHDLSVPEGAAKRIQAAGPKGFRVVVEEIMTVGRKR